MRALATAALVLLVACGRTKAIATAENGKVNITADAKGFTPSAIEVKKGEALTLIFTRTTDDTCATDVVFPETKVKKDLPLNTPVSIEVPTADARTLRFQCGMAMYEGSVVIR